MGSFQLRDWTGIPILQADSLPSEPPWNPNIRQSKWLKAPAWILSCYQKEGHHADKVTTLDLSCKNGKDGEKWKEEQTKKQINKSSFIITFLIRMCTDSARETCPSDCRKMRQSAVINLILRSSTLLSLGKRHLSQLCLNHSFLRVADFKVAIDSEHSRQAKTHLFTQVSLAFPSVKLLRGRAKEGGGNDTSRVRSTTSSGPLVKAPI